MLWIDLDLDPLSLELFGRALRVKRSRDSATRMTARVRRWWA